MGDGALFVYDGKQPVPFSTRFEADGITFQEPEEFLFSFNSPLGACPECGGYGQITGIDEALVVPDKTLSVYQDAIACWRGEVMSFFKNQVIDHAAEVGFSIHTPYEKLSQKEREWLWSGDENVAGIHRFFKHLESARYKIQNRIDRKSVV